MAHSTFDLTAMVGSRICHDLISPIGAISNGVELLEMSGSPGSIPEVALLAESAANANVRIRFFRVAYGSANRGQTVSRRDIAEILHGMSVSGRTRYDWHQDSDQPRSLVKLAFLLIQCLETCLPYGGQISARAEEGHLNLTASGSEVRPDRALWDYACGTGRTAEIGPATVQYALVPSALAQTGRNLSISVEDGRLTVSA